MGLMLAAGASSSYSGEDPPPPTPEVVLVLVPAADIQEDGPDYDFRIGKYEVRNDQYVEFLNDALGNPNNERGQFMYFDSDSGSVFIHHSAVGTVGTDGSGTLLFRPAIGGRISLANGAYQVTNSSFAAHPVVGVTWYGAAKFCNWLTLERGMPLAERTYTEGPDASAWHAVSFDPASPTSNKNGFRLPMDAGMNTASPYNEWYKAASRKTGTNGFGSKFGFGRDTLTNADANFLSSGDPFEIGVTPVGFYNSVNKLANNLTVTNETQNGYRLYDLCGNVAEWVHDITVGEGIVNGATRGGHFTHPAGFPQLRTDVREALPADSALSFIGFRVAQSLLPIPVTTSQQPDQIRMEGLAGGPYDRDHLTIQVQNGAAYSADDLMISISPNWLVVEGSDSLRVPPGGTIDVSLALAPAADILPTSPPPPGSLVLVPGSEAQERGPTHDFWISVSEVTNDQFATFLNDARAHMQDGRGAYLYHDTETGRVFINDDEAGAEGAGPPPGGSNTMLYDAAIGRIRFNNDHYEVETGYGLHPVVGISWYGAIKYCNWLTLFASLPADLRAYAEGPTPGDWHPISIATADWATRSLTSDERRDLLTRTVGYRLPMDGETASASAFNEWFKAASARRDELNRLFFDARYGFGRDVLDGADANYLKSGDILLDTATRVGFFNAINKLSDAVTTTRDTENAYGLYDVCGNVAEWTQDFFAHDDPSMRATRGGSWHDADASASLTNAGRTAMSPAARNAWTGFRVVRGTGHIATITVRDNITNTTTTHHAILDLHEPLSVTPIEPHELSGIYCDDLANQSFSFEFSNQSDSEMPWTVSVTGTGSWLEAKDPATNASTGTVPAGPDGVVPIVATTKSAVNDLAPGEHIATVTFRNPRTGGVFAREVQLTIRQPVEVIADAANPPAEFAGVWGGPFETLPTLRYWFGRSAKAQSDCPTEYAIASQNDWLTVTPIDPEVELSGPLPTEAALFPFDVTINTKANLLGVGEHVGTVRFSYIDRSIPTAPTPVTRTVQLTVIDPIRLDDPNDPWDICCEISPAAFPARAFHLTNLHGSFAVPMTVSTDVDWIDLDTDSFLVLPGGSQSVTATLNENALLSHGIYLGNLYFTDLMTNHTQTRLVRLTIVETMTVSPEADFEAAGRIDGVIAPSSFTYRLTNVEDDSDGAIEWHVSSDQLWARINGQSSASGVLDDGTWTDVVITIDPATAPTLPAGEFDATFEATLTFDDITDGDTITRNVRLSRVVPILTLEEALIRTAAHQPNGPGYEFVLSRFDITNAEFVTFLNNAMSHLPDPRGQYMYFEETTGEVYLNSVKSGEIGDDHDERTVRLFAPGESGQIVFADGAYTVRTSPTDYSRHPVSGVSWYGAVKFCNWASLDRGVSPSQRCYGEGTDSDLSAWRPATIAQADWLTRDLNDAERLELVAECRGYRLPMDDGYNNANPTADAPDDYNEWYKAAAWNDATHQNMVFGFGRNAIAGPDANFKCSGDMFENPADCNVGAATPVGYFDGTVKNGGFNTRADANPFGLYDMTGNVHQWLQDRFAPPASLDRRALRGGSWNDAIGAASLRNPSRPLFAMAGTVSNQIGFRVLRTTAAADGDANGDGVVDSADWAELVTCWFGPSTSRADSCAVFDFNADGQIDLHDAATFQRMLSTSQSP